MFQLDLFDKNKDGKIELSGMAKLVLLFSFLVLLQPRSQGPLRGSVREDPGSEVGLAAAAGGSLFVVIVLRQTQKTFHCLF